MAQEKPTEKACADCRVTAPKRWKGVRCGRCYERARHRKNPEKRAHWRRAYFERNPKKKAEYSRRYREKHPDKERECIRQWAASNGPRRRSYHAQRRAAKRQASPAWAPVELTAAVYQRCPEGYHVDHVIPLTHTDVCGLHVHWNLAYLTPSENSAKNNKFCPEAYAEWLQAPSVTMFLGDRVVPIGGTVSANPDATSGTSIESTDVIGETPCQKK